MSVTIPAFLKPYLPGPVAVLGGGLSGAGGLQLAERVGGIATLFDEKPVVNGLVNNFGPDEARRHPLVVHSPGFDRRHPWLETARRAGCLTLTELDFGAAFWPGRIVAVTGTNGKTTLTEFLTHALRSVGEAAHATGNIGFPFTRLAAEAMGRPVSAVREETAVCEVSSFQAEALQHLAPDATLWTNFAEDHLERHGAMEDYFEAKWRLVERTPSNAVFLGESAWAAAARLGKAVTESARVFSEVKSTDSRLAGTVFEESPQRENFLLAAAWWQRSGHPSRALFEAAGSFRLGRHRLARVLESAGVTWWNDSKATNFHAVEAALVRFPAPVLLIAGGKSKGGDIEGFVRRIAPRVRSVFLLGETAAVLADACRRFSVSHERCSGLAEAVEKAAAAARSGDHVLLSPGFASFDQFRSYEDRGNQFETLVNNLGVTPSF